MISSGTPPGTSSQRTAQGGTRPGSWPGPGPGAAGTTPAAPPRDHQPSPAAGSWSAAPRRPPTGHRSGRSCCCRRWPAAGPGRPAWAARPAPARRPRRAAGPAGGPGRRRPRAAQVRSGHFAAQVTSRCAWPAEAPTRRLPSGSSAAPIATAVCDPLYGSTPIITDVISTLQSSFRNDETAAGMPNYGAGARSSSGTTPRQDPAGWHLVIKPDRDCGCGRQAVREPAHWASRTLRQTRNIRLDLN